MLVVSEKLKHPRGSSGLWEAGAEKGMRTLGVAGGRSSERERLPPFYSGADLHNDQRLSCLSKLFSAICIIFCRAGGSGKGRAGARTARQDRVDGERGWTPLLSTLECILCARLMKL